MVGVKRGELQNRIQSGELRTFEGAILLSDLLHFSGVAQGALRAKVINQKPKTRCREFAACVFLREVSSKC
jgi:hypothetical protein